jgi:hypothetical protein
MVERGDQEAWQPRRCVPPCHSAAAGRELLVAARTRVKNKIIWERGHFYVVVDGVKVTKRGHPDFDPKAPLSVQFELASTRSPLVGGYAAHEDDDGNVLTYQGVRPH